MRPGQGARRSFAGCVSWLSLAGAAAALACGGKVTRAGGEQPREGSRTSAPPASIGDAGSAADAASPMTAPAPREVPCAAPSCAVIDGAGVGEVRIGAPLRGSLLGADAERRYVARFVADAQPIEGFRLDAPPVLAIVRGKKARTGQPSARAARAAVRQARAGKLRVTSIHIDDPALRTVTGAGVGSTLAELRRAHPDARAHPVPPTYGGDECVAIVPGLEQVWFYFASCDSAAGDGRVVRVLIAGPDGL